jgi:hypothetical protein
VVAIKSSKIDGAAIPVRRLMNVVQVEYYSGLDGIFGIGFIAANALQRTASFQAGVVQW